MKKEDFFEVLGELEDDIVKEAEVTMMKKINWKIWGTMAACLAVVAILGIGMLQSYFMAISNADKDVSSTDTSTIDLKPIVNFEGIVVAVEDDSVTLDNGTIVIITEDTGFASGPDMGHAVSKDVRVGNFIQGYTKDDVDADKITASKIWTNEVRPNADGKSVDGSQWKFR